MLEHVEAAAELAARIRAELAKAVVGQREAVDMVLACLIAGGHVLLEGVPGVGKTLVARALAKTFGGATTRVQFTPDLMPADVVGHVLYDAATGAMKLRKGPVFTNLLLADEINRAPAKTQAALLEVMQERQVTIEGESLASPAPFMTLATQNPIEMEGTYPLPEAQLDRFLMKVRIAYPSEAEEVELTRHVTENRVGDALPLEAVQVVATPEDVLRLQAVAAQLTVDERVREYAVRVVRATREAAGVAIGAGPRGGIALIRVARANALLENRSFVVPDDVKSVARAVLRHRILLSPEAELEDRSADAVIEGVLEDAPAPRA
ncbi:MAG TPA: MoxR family ATPase [Myxococcota bacterium]|nr:MoxR family ATPase [Myxococcota bacterium]